MPRTRSTCIIAYHEPQCGEIYQSIEALDRRGMQLIEAQDAAGFASYQREYGNTICGRHPIAVLLHSLAECAAKHAIAHQCRFVQCAGRRSMPWKCSRRA